MVSAVGRLAARRQAGHPQAILERSRRPGRSAGALARTLEEFFLSEHLAFGLDQEARLAAWAPATPRRRHPGSSPTSRRRFRRPPGPLRGASSTGGDPSRADTTIEQTSGIVARPGPLRGRRSGQTGLGHGRRRRHRSVLDGTAGQPASPAAGRPPVLSVGRKNKVVLVDPTRGLPGQPRVRVSPARLSASPSNAACSAAGPATRRVHPHEALVGILALLHATSSLELRQLQVTDFDPVGPSLRIGRRPPIPLDPVSVAAIQRCLAHRSLLGTQNPHLIVTTQTKTRSTPASTAYLCPRARRSRGGTQASALPRGSSIWS